MGMRMRMRMGVGMRMRVRVRMGMRMDESMQKGEGQGWKEDAVVRLVREEELAAVWRETQCGGSVSGALR